MTEPPADADRLYGLPLHEFVPERDALARALRAEGRRADAGAVAALRKPTIAAWAVNQVVRTQRKAVHELIAAGDELRAGQAALLAGKAKRKAKDPAGELRRAGERERAAVESLVQAAAGLLDRDGHGLSRAVLERVADTLRAAALDGDAREQVCEARLVRELRYAGLGLTAEPPAERR